MPDATQREQRDTPAQRISIQKIRRSFKKLPRMAIDRRSIALSANSTHGDRAGDTNLGLRWRTWIPSWRKEPDPSAQRLLARLRLFLHARVPWLRWNGDNAQSKLTRDTVQTRAERYTYNVQCIASICQAPDPLSSAPLNCIRTKVGFLSH